MFYLTEKNTNEYIQVGQSCRVGIGNVCRVNTLPLFRYLDSLVDVKAHSNTFSPVTSIVGGKAAAMATQATINDWSPIRRAIRPSPAQFITDQRGAVDAT
jgi:hypothetical protein